MEELTKDNTATNNMLESMTLKVEDGNLKFEIIKQELE